MTASRMGATAGLAPALEQLVAVADAEHVTRAADALGVPQPTVSRTMARLSGELGVPLLARDGRAVRLTPQARLLAEHARRALSELRAGVAAVRADVDADAGHVTLGFLHSMGPAAVPQLLRGFHEQYPGVRVSLVQDAADRVSDRVVAGEVDLALVSPAPRHSRLAARTLARQDLVLLVPRRHRFTARSSVPIAELAGEPLVTLRRGYGVRTITDDLLRRHGVAPRYSFESDELGTVAGLAAAGLGLAILPAGSARPAPAGAVEVALGDRHANRAIVLVWSRDRDLPVPVARLRQHLLEHGPSALA